MTLSIKARGDVFALSRRKQTAAATAASIAGTGNGEGMLLHTDEGSAINVTDERRDNQDQKTGFAEGTDIDILTRRAEGTITVPRAAPDPLAWMSAFFTGTSAMTTPTGGTLSRLHTQRVSQYAEEPPYFTGVHRKGGSGGSPAMIERIVGNSLNTFRFSLTKGEFVSCSADVQGLGFVANAAPFGRGIFKEVKTVDFTTALTGALSYDVEGTSDADAATNIQAWVDSDGDGIFETPLVVSSYSSTTDLATIDETASGVVLTGNHDVEFVYPVKATVTTYYGSPSWRTEAESLVIVPEFKMRAGSMQIRLGGTIEDAGPADEDIELVGGQIAACEIDSLEYTGDWQGQIGYCWRAGTTEQLNATQVVRGDLRQTIRINRRARDWFFAQRYLDNAFLSVYVDAIGPVDAIEPGYTFLFKAWFPRCKFLNKPYQITEGRWADAGEILVLAPQPGWHTNGLMNSAVFQVQNAVANGGNGYL